MYVDDDMLDQLTEDEWNFNIKDLDQEALDKKSKEEADGVWMDGVGPQVHGRTYEKLLEDCRRGNAAEHYLIEKQGFKNDDRAFKDVFDPSGASVEVKVTTSTWTADKYTIPACNEARSTKDNWRNFSDIVYLFINPKESEDYSLYKILTWDGHKFI